MPDLKIDITANIGDTEQKLKTVTKGLTDVSTSATKASTSLGKMSGAGAQQATTALTNLGRVAQDLPFGFVGIQNNLNPLLESFQRLKAETGSGVTALKALGSSLIGAGGIGLALSVVSSAIVIFQSGIAGFNKKTKEATDKSKDFAQSLEDVAASGLAAGIKLQNFVNIAKDNTQSLETRNEALLQANKILGDHGEKLTLVNIATKGVTDQINKYTEATIQQGLANKFVDRIADIIIKQRDAIKDYTKELNNTNKAQQEFADFQKIAGPGSGMEEALIGQSIELSKQKGKLFETAGAYRTITKELSDLTGQLGTAQVEAAKLFGELGHKTKTEDVKKNVKEIKAEIEKAFVAEKIILKPQLIEVSPEQILLDKEKAEKEFNDQLGKFKMVPIKIPLFIEDADIIAQTKRLQETFLALVQDVGSSLGKSIASGGNILKGVFESVLHVMGDFLIKLGTAAVLTSKLYLAIKASSSNPISGIVGGVIAIIAGEILKNVKFPGFAQGVQNFGGGWAVVGERGPEMVRLPKGSDVIPNHSLGGIGASSTVFIPDIKIRGNDLLVVFNRAAATSNRNN